MSSNKLVKGGKRFKIGSLVIPAGQDISTYTSRDAENNLIIEILASEELKTLELGVLGGLNVKIRSCRIVLE